MLDVIAGFSPINRHSLSIATRARMWRHEVASLATPPPTNDQEVVEEIFQQPSFVRAPLKFIGPYPCLALKFPTLATSSQRSRNVTGVSLDFLLDTAANTNTIQGPVAQELNLPPVGKSLPGVGAGGALPVGTTYLLGDCQLEGLPKEEPFTFLEGLTASALPVASPAAAGLLSLSFFQCFEGGVEFQWNGGDDGFPSVTFYSEGASDESISSMTKVEISELPITRLPSIQIMINGVVLPALLDTGSPITVINAQAAKRVGIRTIDVPGLQRAKTSGGNLLTTVANRFKDAQAMAQAAGRGEILTIASVNGERVNLLKSDAKVNLAAEGGVDFGSSHVFVGNLPGLAALNALGDESAPAAVLGMDVLRMRPKMLFRPRDRAAYF